MYKGIINLRFQECSEKGYNSTLLYIAIQTKVPTQVEHSTYQIPIYWYFGLNFLELERVV